MRKKIVARRIQSLSGRRKFLILLLPCRYYQQGKRVTASCLSNPLLFFFWEGAFLPASLLNGGQIWYDKEKRGGRVGGHFWKKLFNELDQAAGQAVTRTGQNTRGSITRSTRLVSSSARLGSF
jgi:hypothetical protein